MNYLKKYEKKYKVKTDRSGDFVEYVIICKNGIIDVWDLTNKILRYNNSFDYIESKNQVKTPVSSKSFSWIVKKLKVKHYFDELDISEYLQEIRFPEAYLEDISKILKVKKKKQLSSKELYRLQQLAIRNFKRI